MITYANPELTVGEGNKAYWNLAYKRRYGFHNLHRMNRHDMGFRAPNVLKLSKDIDRRIGDLAAVRRLTGTASFSAMAVVRDQRLLFEAYACDFGPDQIHTLQSISKTTMNLVFGRLVEDDKVDLGRKVAHYIPEIGSGYAEATVQQVLDMDVMNNFNEDYSDPYEAPRPGATVGYGRQEIAMGWRLPPDGERTFTCHDFLCSLVSDDVTNRTGETQYRSVNTDLLGWIAERASGRSLRALLIDIAEAAGIEGVFRVSTDGEGTPYISGGVFLTAQDLCRYGLLFARKGLGVHGKPVGSAAFIDETRRRGTRMPAPRERLRYSNQTNTDGRWLGHGGYGGQYMLADPESGVVVAFFSVLENDDAVDATYHSEIIGMSEEIMHLFDGVAR
ncbi:MAG: class C beta-lactamase-related serine hydrolase [Alphaproteobacteria bacterium]|nr:class C beta-lactamase-related serine hydrolase [Alphaproteobacteria bacterium]